MMAKTRFVQALDQVQASLTPTLKENGFRVRGRSCNRAHPGGLVHVIHFQMGQYPLGTAEIPGLRENLYGHFTVNLGVFLPCVAEIEFNRQPKSFVQEMDCQIRARLGSLQDPDTDTWWDLNRESEKLSLEIRGLLETYGLPFLDRFDRYGAVVQYFEAFGDLPYNSPGRSALIVAIVVHHLGQDQKAQVYFDKALQIATREQSHPGFLKHIKAIRDKCLTASNLI